MNDAPLYTGVDNDQNGGPFGNEVPNKASEAVATEQRQMIAELTPKLQSIVDMLKAEKKTTMDFIAGYVDANKDDDNNFRIELKAAGRYRKYLDDLATKFGLALEEVKGNR